MNRTRAILYVVVMLGGSLAAPSAVAQRGRAPQDSLTAQQRKMLAIAKQFAARCEAALESWLAQKETTKHELFSFLYYPVAGSDPPKFNTDWDGLADRDIRAISDEVLGEGGGLVFAVMVDRNGYLPAHNSRYSQPLTKNRAFDLVNNRTKRIFSDKTGLAAARSTAPYLVQKYSRDTGEEMEDLSVPIRVQGKHWGAVRLGYQTKGAP